MTDTITWRAWTLWDRVHDTQSFLGLETLDIFYDGVGATVAHAVIDGVGEDDGWGHKEGKTLCGRPAPAYPDTNSNVVCLWWRDNDGRISLGFHHRPKCKRCLKKEGQ